MKPGPDPREVRVFISSTFLDMEAEREELCKQVFPELRRLCEKRGVVWGEVDLRWGVPDEASAEGSVLPICLAEIERCRPYFIGLLGERYGWVPNDVPAELLDAQPWLAERHAQSVTALEMFHGALRDPKMARHALFYFRDPAYAANRAGFIEEDSARRSQLVALKEAIRNSGLPVMENFGTPQQLGQWVLRDLTAVIDEHYPASSSPDALQRAAADHEAYADSRRRIYVRRPEYIERLDGHMAGDGPPLVLSGESGGGKSALLANWIAHQSRKQPETPAFVHFIGATPDSSNWMAMLRRLIGEFRRLGIQVEDETSPEGLRVVFANALHMIAARGRALLVLDGLDQIEDAARDLLWVPSRIPTNIRLVVSTAPGRALTVLQRRGWRAMEVEPLTPRERQQLIVDYLRQYGKELSADLCHRICDAAQSSNPLYLTTLLNELRLFGHHESLGQRLGWYLEAADPIELYGKVLSRWQGDYQRGPESSDLLRYSLSRIWSARHGLSEAELLESMGSASEPMPHAAWSPLRAAAGDAFVDRGGLLTFTHDFLRTAVERTYLPTPERQRDAHRSLAAYFAGPYFAGQPPGPRQLDELPWQLQQGADWEGMAKVLAQPAFFDALWDRDQFETKAYWTRLETHSLHNVEEAYAAARENPSLDSEHSWRVGRLLTDLGRTKAAERLTGSLVAVYQARGDRHRLAIALNNHGVLLHFMGDLSAALAAYREAEALCRELGNKDGLQKSLGNQAMILHLRGDLDASLALHEDEEFVCRELGNQKDLHVALENRALIIAYRGDPGGALALHVLAERDCRARGDQQGLQTTLGNQAAILSRLGNFDGALALLEEKERICRDLGYVRGLKHCLANLAVIRRDLGDLAGASELHREEERLCRELGDWDGLQQSLGNQAVIAGYLGDDAAAMSLLQEQESICRRQGNKDGLASAMNGQAAILQARGDASGALALAEENDRICRELGDVNGIAVALGQKAELILQRGDLAGALALLREQDALYRRIGDRQGLAYALNNQANVLKAQREIAEAWLSYKEAERLGRELGTPLPLAVSLRNQASMLACVPAFRRVARRLADEALDVVTRHGYQAFVPDFQQTVQSIGNVAEDDNDTGALDLAFASQPGEDATQKRSHPLLGEMEAAAMEDVGLRHDAAARYEALLAAMEEDRAQRGDEAYDQAIARLYSRLGTIAMEQGDVTGAAGHYRRAMDLRERLATGNPQFLRELGYSYERIGFLMLGQQKYDEAEEFLQKELNIVGDLVRQSPDDSRLLKQMSVATELLSDVMLTTGRVLEAHSLLEMSMEHADRAVQLQPALEHARQLAMARQKMGDLLYRAGRHDLARPYHASSLTIRQQLIDEEPQNVDYQTDFATSLMRVGNRAALVRAFNLLSQLEDQHRLTAAQSSWIPHLRKVIENLDPADS